MPYSNYSKIRDLLRQLAQQGSPQELGSYIESVRAQEIESFSIWRAGPGPDQPPVKSTCSADAIRHLVKFVSELGLVSVDEGGLCSLTGSGQRAQAEGNYDKVLATHLAMYLKDKAGVTYTDVKDAIRTIQRPEVPSFATIYQALGRQKEIGVPEEQFRGLLYLLERCGMLSTQIRKLYFAPEAQL